MASTPKFFLTIAVTGLLAGCWPQDSNTPQKSTTSQGQGQMSQGQGMMGGGQGRMGRGGGLRRMCADEIQKYCSEDKRKLNCLQDNMDRLGDSCKTALNTAIQRRAARMGAKQQANGTQQPGAKQQPAPNNSPDGDE